MQKIYFDKWSKHLQNYCAQWNRDRYNEKRIQAGVK